MKTKIFAFVGLLAALLCVSTPASAQLVTLTSTTASAAIAAADKSICLTSATGVVTPGNGAAGSTLFILDGITSETVTVRSVTTSSASCFNVIRANRPVDHASGVTIYIGSGNNYYSMAPAGTCTTASMAVRPWINVQTGIVWDCVNSVWAPINDGPLVSTCGTAAAGSAAACSATTIKAPAKIVIGTVALTSGSPSTAAITAMPAFTSTTTYACTATSQTTQTTVLKAIPVSATAFTITGPNTNTDVVSYLCIGY